LGGRQPEGWTLFRRLTSLRRSADGSVAAGRAQVRFLATVAALVGCLLAAPAAASGFEKTLPLNPSAHSATKMEAALDLARSAGVSEIQTYATWWWLTRNGGTRSYEWSDLDRLIGAAERRGMRVVLQLNGTPDWVHPDLASSVPNLMDRIWYPPVRNDTELGHWADFVNDVVSRYRGRVAHYELWNEPNLPMFWRPEPNVNDYAKLLRAGYYAAKQADPGATVVFAGLAYNDVGYLDAFYDTVDHSWPAEASSERYFFDVLDVHPYSDDRSPRILDPQYTYQGRYGEVDHNFMGFRRLKAIMDARDSGDKPVFIGEYGFPAWMIDDGRRAEYLRDAYSLAAAEDYVNGMSWYSFVPEPDNGGWEIVDDQLRPSQTFEALRSSPSTPPTLITPPPAQPQPAADPADAEAPRVRVKRKRRVRYSAAASRGISLSIRCSEACRASADVLVARRSARPGAGTTRSRKKRKVGRDAGRTDDAGAVQLQVRLRRRTIDRLREAGRSRMHVQILARDPQGNETAVDRVVILSR
jgi:Cellulase (glycosyl hydrolase family 5)